MTKIEIAGCVQEAVLWPFASFDRHGNPRVGEPVEIMSRWEKGILEALEGDGAPVIVHGRVMVDREIAVGSILRKGELAELPGTPDKLMEVVDYEEIPDDKGREIQRNVRVQRWKEHLPDIV